MCAAPASIVKQKQRSPRCEFVIVVIVWQFNRAFVCLFVLRQLQGKGCDILKGSGYCLILQELQVHEEGLDLLRTGWHHPNPGKA